MERLLLSSLPYCLFLCLIIACGLTMPLAATATVAKKAPIKKAAIKKVAKPASQTKPTAPAQTIVIHVHTDGSGTAPATMVTAVPPAQPGSSGGDSSDKKDAEIAGGTLGAVGTAVGSIAATVYAKHKEISKANAADEAQAAETLKWTKVALPEKLLEEATKYIKNQEVAAEKGEKPNVSEARDLEIINEAILKNPKIKTSLQDIRIKVRDDLRAQKELQAQIAVEKEELALKKQQQDRNVQEARDIENNKENMEESEAESEFFEI